MITRDFSVISIDVTGVSLSLLLTKVTHAQYRIFRKRFRASYNKKIQKKSWSLVPPKLLACIRFLYKVVDLHKIGRLQKSNHARESEFNFFIAWTIFMKLGTLVYHVHGYKMKPQIF